MRGHHAAVGRGLARLLLRLQHHRAGAVAEQHAGAAIVPVEDAREGLGTDHQRALEGACAQEIVGGGEREHETGAHGLKVEGRAMIDAEPVLHGDSRRREGVVRRRGRQHDQVDRLRVHAGIAERRLRRLDRQVRGEFALGRDVPLANTGALHDPLVGGVDPRRQLRVGHHLLRQIRATAEHDRTNFRHETASCAACTELSAPPSRLSI